MVRASKNRSFKANPFDKDRYPCRSLHRGAGLTDKDLANFQWEVVGDDQTNEEKQVVCTDPQPATVDRYGETHFPVVRDGAGHDFVNWDWGQPVEETSDNEDGADLQLEESYA